MSDSFLTAASRSTIFSVDETRPSIVEVTGALAGRYELQERYEDGSVLLGPDTSLKATLGPGERLASSKEFKAAFGDLPTGSD